MRLLCLSAVLAVSGCQCFIPVDEPDASIDAGTDAGVSIDAGCTSATQCTGPAPATSHWCENFIQPDAGFSCVASECLWECPLVAAGRTCTVNQGTYCLECGDAGTKCPTTGTCAPTATTTATVESGTCAGFTGVTFTRGASAQCRYLLSTPTQTLGELWRLDDLEYVAFLPSLGGWCTGRTAFTGVPRSIISCPSCQFVLMGFE